MRNGLKLQGPSTVMVAIVCLMGHFLHSLGVQIQVCNICIQILVVVRRSDIVRLGDKHVKLQLLGLEFQQVLDL